MWNNLEVINKCNTSKHKSIDWFLIYKREKIMTYGISLGNKYQSTQIEIISLINKVWYAKMKVYFTVLWKSLGLDKHTNTQVIYSNVDRRNDWLGDKKITKFEALFSAYT